MQIVWKLFDVALVQTDCPSRNVKSNKARRYAIKQNNDSSHLQRLNCVCCCESN